MKLLVTGAAGFIGSTYVRLAEEEHEVRVLDKLTYAGRRENVPDGAELVYGEDRVWPVLAFRNVYILPGVPSLFRRKFVSIRERFRSLPFYVARVYVMADETAIAPDLNRMVAAHPQVSFGSYPRFEETDYRVLLTMESQDLDAVVRATGELAASLGGSVVRVEEVGPPRSTLKSTSTLTST